MDPVTEKIIAEKTQGLPQGVKDALSKINVPEQLQVVAQKNNLRADEGGALETEVLLAVLGISQIDHLVDSLIQHGHFSKEVAVRLTQDIEENIFKKIRNSAIETQGQSQASPVPIPAPGTLAADIAKAKLEGSFHLPPDNITIKNQPPTTNDQQPAGTKIYKGTDPYREAVK